MFWRNLGRQLRASWGRSRALVGGNPLAVLLAAAFLLWLIPTLLVTIRAGRTGFGARSLWDWLDLLIVPLALAVLALYLNRSERAAERRAAEQRAMTEREIAATARHQATLEAYYDRMAELMLPPHELLDSAAGSPVRVIAQARTLAALRSLDARRVSQLARFLAGAGLSAREKPLIDFQGADLSGASFAGANLSRLNLAGINLAGADLRGADLSESDLSGADLSQAALPEANLSSAILTSADLSETDLREADLSDAQASGAILGHARLGGAYLLRADLTRAVLVNADLCEAHLYDADLGEARLAGADLSGVDLLGDLFGKKLLLLSLRDADLTGATMPDGRPFAAWLPDQPAEIQAQLARPNQGG
jgi:uncharacterized protein YjbI with pentapeptide repeats